MDYDLYSRLVYELKLLEDERDRQLSRLFDLDAYREMQLKRSRATWEDGFYYYAKLKMPGSKFKYVGSGDNKIVLRVKEAAHLNASVSRLDENIRLIESLLDGFRDYDYDAVEEDLPRTYRSNIRLLSTPYQLAGSKWKKDRLIFQSQFPENYPERKTEITSDGIKVKSISEVVVYERLKAAGLYFVYELPLVSKDYGPNLYPDFTVLSPIDRESEIIVEYAGLLNKPEYREDFARRVYRYMRNGYVPGVNLFFIFSDMDGHVDSLQINKVIADIKGIRGNLGEKAAA